MKIKGVAAIPLDSLPLNAIAKFLRTRDEVDGDVLLTGADKDCYMKIFIKARQIDLLNILKIDEQQFVAQFDLAAEIMMPGAAATGAA